MDEVTLLQMAIGLWRLSGKTCESSSRLLGNIAFETANGFSLAHSVFGVTMHVRLGARVMTQPGHHQAAEAG